jgi:hypothetical protein
MPIIPNQTIERTQTNGIFMGDILLRTALIEGIRRLRADPRLLDYCFAFLPNDELTAQTYGLPSLERAKTWFLNTEIFVFMEVKIDQPKMPALVINLVDDSEDANSLGYVNDETQEGLSTDPATGVLLESVFCRETYRIDTVAQGEPEVAINLYAITKFVLFKYRKELLEGRGFERSTIQGSAFGKLLQDMQAQNVFGRSITITGFVKNYWPSDISLKVSDIQVQFASTSNDYPGVVVLDGQKTPDTIDLSNSMWIMEGDKDSLA